MSQSLQILLCVQYLQYLPWERATEVDSFLIFFSDAFLATAFLSNKNVKSGWTNLWK